jgi:gamma-glutamylcyclotransferase (GGCT)/AIG2-like uncharacterized protein YtfP
LTQLLFVYGTLRRGEPGPEAARLAAGSRLLGLAHVRGEMIEVQGHRALLVGRGERVEGELLHVTDPALWAELDAYEGVGEAGWFRRELVVAIDEQGQPRSAWSYTAHARTT